MTNIPNKLKLGLMAFAAMGMTAAASSAEARPYRPYHHKQRITKHQYRVMKRANRRKARRDFRNLDKHRNGVLTRADFVLPRRYSYRYEWRRTSHGWHRVRVRDYRRTHVRHNRRQRRAMMRKWNQLRRVADTNHDNRVTRHEFIRARRLIFERKIRHHYIVMNRYRTPYRVPYQNPYRRTRF